MNGTKYYNPTIDASWTNFHPDGEAPDSNDLSKGLKYAKFKVEIPNEQEGIWEVIKMYRGFAKAMEGTRICYEQLNKYGGFYTLIVSRMDENTLLSLESVGIEITRGYKTLSRKYRRKHFHKIRL